MIGQRTDSDEPVELAASWIVEHTDLRGRVIGEEVWRRSGFTGLLTGAALRRAPAITYGGLR